MAVPAGVIVGWPLSAASIPATWSRETALDTRHVKMVATAATNPGTTGGSNTHAHPFPVHTHTGASHGHVSPDTSDFSTLNAQQNNYSNQPNGMAYTHHHATSITAALTAATGSNTGPANFDTATSEPPYIEVIFIRSDGSPSGLPASCIAFFNAAAPTGWTAYAAGANRFWKGAPTSGNGGSTGGSSDAHGHTSATHGHPSGGTHDHGGSATSPGSGYQASGPAGPAGSEIVSAHAHTFASNTGTAVPTFGNTVAAQTANGDAQPPWFKLLPVQNTSGSNSYPFGIICVWTGTVASIPSGWKICDGSFGTPNLLTKFVKGAASSGEVGNTGGASTHTHATGAQHLHAMTTHAHTMPATTNFTSGVNLPTSEVSPGQTMNGHSHTMSGSTNTDGTGNSGLQNAAATANTDNQPAHTTVVYIRLNSLAPLAPTINVPVAGNVFDTSITLSATTTDPETETWSSRWEYSPDNGSNYYAVPGTGTIVASGAASTLLWDTTALAGGTLYKVRAWGVDSSGSTGPKTTLTGNFTIDHNHDPNAPTLVAPSSGAVVDLAAMPMFTWTFSDPDAGDAQSAYAIKFRRTSDSFTRWWDGAAWQTAETYVTTGTQQATPNNSIFAKGEPWVWSVRTKDSGGPSGIKTGPYSTERAFTASTKIQPVITDPTGGAPANIPTSFYTMIWTATEQTKWRARLLLGPGFSTVIQDTGITVDSVTRQAQLGPMSNSTTVRFEITTYNTEGLASTPVTIDKTVSYTTGAAPVVVVTPRN